MATRHKHTFKLVNTIVEPNDPLHYLKFYDFHCVDEGCNTKRLISNVLFWQGQYAARQYSTIQQMVRSMKEQP